MTMMTMRMMTRLNNKDYNAEACHYINFANSLLNVQLGSF